ncbi:MAG: VIT1/CCC1 transporter family protein [Ferruginibacter sp.]
MQEQLPKVKDKNLSKIHIYTKQYIAGIGDGIALIFAFCFSLSVLYSESKLVFNIGSIAAMLMSVIIGIGGYFAAKSRQRDLIKKTPEQEKAIYDAELSKTIQLFKKLDLGKDLQELAAEVIASDEKEWKNYLEQQQQPTEQPEARQVYKSMLVGTLASVTGSVIGLIPWVFTHQTSTAFIYSQAFCLPMLFIAGFLKSKVNGEPIWWGGIRQLLLGAALAWVGFLIAKIFEQP